MSTPNPMDAYVERFRTWWDGLAQRERRMVSAGAAALAAFLLYGAIWQPLAHVRASRTQALTESRALAVRLETIAADSKKGTDFGALPPGQSLLAAVDQSSKTAAFGKAPTRLQPEGDNAVKIWLDDVPFDAVVRWVHDLQARYGIRVEAAEIEREAEPGKVNARFSLVKTS